MIRISDNLEVNKPAPIDDRLGVFSSTASALAYIPEDRRYIGLTVIVDTGSGATEYWFESGVEDGDLTAKSTGGGGGGVPYTGATQNVDLGEYQMKAGQYEFDQTPTQTAGVAKLRWNDTDGTLDLGLKGGNVTLQIGQEQVVRVVNGTGANLLEANYQAVRITGAQGQRLQVLLAQANNDANSADTIGLVTETINNNQEGFITTSGIVRGIDASGALQGETWNDGDVLYLSGTTPGAITNIKPTAPIHTVIVGYVVYNHQINGKIFVKVDNGYELDELHNVYINPATLADNDALIYESSTDLWKNKQVTKAMVGLGNVDNTADVNKPISTATQTALNNRSISIGTAGSVSITIAGTGSGNLQSLTGHGFTIAESSMPIGATIQVNGMTERIATSTGVGGVSYDVNGVKRYFNSPSGHQYQYQFTIYRESSTTIRMWGGTAGSLPLGTFASVNIASTTATVTPGGNIVLQLFGFGSVANDQIAYRFFKAILTR